LLENGNYGEALTAIEQALALIPATADHSFEAECWRLKGDLIWRCRSDSARLDEAENCLSKAVEISRQQKALSLELRAQVSLGQLLTQKGEAESAQRSLAETYAQFQEDFGSEDLRQAKTALDRLRSLTSCHFV